MNKQQIINFIHEEISSVLHTTQEFTLKDTEILVDKLIDLNVLYSEEREYELREAISLMELVNMAKDDIEHGRTKPAGSFRKELEEKIK